MTRTNILIINDDPVVAELQKRLIEAHATHPVRVTIRDDVSDAVKQGNCINAHVYIVDPGAGQGLAQLMSGSNDPEVICVTGYPVSALPDQPLDVPHDLIVRWGVGDAFSDFVKDRFGEPKKNLRIPVSSSNKELSDTDSFLNGLRD